MGLHALQHRGQEATGIVAYDGLERLKAEYPEAQEAVERYAPAILHVVPETMEQFLAELRARYGTYDDLAASLDVTEAVATLRTTVLVDA